MIQIDGMEWFDRIRITEEEGDVIEEERERGTDIKAWLLSPAKFTDKKCTVCRLMDRNSYW